MDHSSFIMDHSLGAIAPHPWAGSLKITACASQVESFKMKIAPREAMLFLRAPSQKKLHWSGG
jgi:hypothetical protein